MRVSFIGVLTGLAILAAPSVHAQVITGFEEYAGAANGTVLFRTPSNSGSTSGNIATTPNIAQVSDEKAFTGTQSMKVEYAWKDLATTRWLRLTTFNATSLRNPTIDFTQALTMKVFIDSQDPLGFILGVRETNATVDIGANGGTSGSIEFVGSTTPTGAPTPTANRILTPGAWHDLSFVLPSEPMGSLTGNGILESTTGKGVFENLAIRSMGAGTDVRLYIDDVRVVPANAIPEPGTMALLAGGLLPLLGLRRKR